MKKQLALVALLTLVSIIGFNGAVYAETETIDFESIPVGTPVGSIDNDLVTIDGDSMEVVEEALGNSSILSYNSNVYGTNGDGGENWLPGDNKRSLGNLSSNWSPTGQDLTITFNPGIVVSSFSIDMFDYGDWFPIGGSNPREATLTAYDSDDAVLDTDPLSISYDVPNNDVSQAGAIPLSVSGNDIAYVKLTFADVDPGVTFDNLSFEYEEGLPLCAGQDIPVGNIITWNDGTNLYVKYVISDSDWCITETHLHVADILNDIPQKNGNPIPGKFMENDEHGCVKDVLYTLSLPDNGWSADTDLYIAAHAVVKDTSAVACDLDDAAIVYGIKRYTGDVYEVDALDGSSSSLIFTIEGVPVGSAKPNGLAYDSMNDRLYFCEYQNNLSIDPTTLYFWDGVQQQTAGELGTVQIADAAFYNGKYYYITGPPASDDLYEVTFNADGSINVITPLGDISNNTHGWTFNGDIAIMDGVLYGWGHCLQHGYEFFTYNLFTNLFTVNKTSYNASLQLAFGSDGTLYGHRSGDPGNFFTINLTNGEVTGPLPNPSGILFTDCASGLRCYNAMETAWGNGPCADTPLEFPGKNWATYYEYTVE